jgi:hypothetical protein
VLIDACQAESIADDPGVRQIERLIDGTAQRARTAYLLAARRGEPAGESAALEHGLMTYVLLKGLGDPQLKPVAGLDLFDQLPCADRNCDRIITTDELQWFVAAVLPKLSAQLPALVMRAGADGQSTPSRQPAMLGQTPRVQAADTSFTLINLPPTAPGVNTASPP